MSFGYIGATPSQVKDNNGIFSLADINNLDALGTFGGAYEHIQSITANNQNSIEFTNIAEDQFDLHVLLSDNTSSTTNSKTQCRLSSNGGTSYINSNYQRCSRWGNSANNDNGTYGSTNEDAIYYSVNTDNSSNTATNGAYIKFYNLGQARKKLMTFEHTGFNINNSTYYGVYGGYAYRYTTVINAIKFFSHAGNLSQGEFHLFGVRRKK